MGQTIQQISFTTNSQQMFQLIRSKQKMTERDTDICSEERKISLLLLNERVDSQRLSL